MEKPIKITDIKKLYHIKTLHASNESIWSLFKILFAYACLAIVLTIAMITIIRQIWKCTPKTQPKANRNFDQVELRHIFDNVGGCLAEERINNDSSEVTCQETLSSPDRIVRFPA